MALMCAGELEPFSLVTQPPYRHLNLEITQGPDQVAQLVRALSQYTKAAGWVPSQGTYKKELINV